MRRRNFFVGAVVALVTFIVLSAFVRRPWGWHRGWRSEHCYNRNDDRRDRVQPGNRPPAVPQTDTAATY